MKPKIKLTSEQLRQLFQEVDALDNKPKKRKIKIKPPSGTITWKHIMSR